jgi:hypothetical protein
MSATDPAPSSLIGRFADFLGSLTDRVKIRAQEAGDDWRRAHSLYAFRHASLTCVFFRLCGALFAPPPPSLAWAPLPVLPLPPFFQGAALGGAAYGCQGRPAGWVLSFPALRAGTLYLHALILPPPHTHPPFFSPLPRSRENRVNHVRPPTNVGDQVHAQLQAQYPSSFINNCALRGGAPPPATHTPFPC